MFALTFAALFAPQMAAAAPTPAPASPNAAAAQSLIQRILGYLSPGRQR